MAFDLAAVKTALVNQVQTAMPAGRTLNAYPQDPGEVRSCPSVATKPGEPYVLYHLTFGDNALCAVNLILEVRVQAREIDAQIAIDAYCSAGTGQTASIRAAVEADRTLGGVVGDCCVMAVHVPEEPDESGDLVARFDVEIHQSRS